ncbi:hypothetical protein KBY70_13880, partial [Cyanobium sp. ATX 6E8]|nr:hypothetical protein [Cyanobium sp. ATX 6E8]
VFSLRMICSAVCLVRFMVKSPAQSGRLRTLIHPGPIAGVHVMIAWIFTVVSTGSILLIAWLVLRPRP